MRKANEEKKNADGAVLGKRADTKVVKLFQKIAHTVPAYKDFLKKAKIDPTKIISIAAFKEVPHTSKENYVLKYPLADRVPRGDISAIKVVASSSGSTGDPVFWPRGIAQERAAHAYHDEIYTENFLMDKKSTLAIIAFPFGVYVSGIATALPSFAFAQKHKTTIVTAGLNKEGILGVMKEFSLLFRQTLLVGHPFFVKDILQSAAKGGLPLKKYHLKLLTCSEGFSEEWRDYMLKIIGSRTPSDIINTYGSSEFLLIGHETKETIAIRRRASRLSSFSVFDTPAVPNLFEFNPETHYVESQGDALILSADSGIPLIRYMIGDRGATHDRESLLRRPGSAASRNYSRPLVSLSGRLDQALLFHGINIYPEHFHHAFNSRMVLRFITGRFVLERVLTKRMDPFLSITVELNSGIRSSGKIVTLLECLAEKTLRKESIEYRFLREQVKSVLPVRVFLRSYQDPQYFKPGMKPKYIRQEPI